MYLQKPLTCVLCIETNYIFGQNFGGASGEFKGALQHPLISCPDVQGMKLGGAGLNINSRRL